MHTQRQYLFKVLKFSRKCPPSPSFIIFPLSSDTVANTFSPSLLSSSHFTHLFFIPVLIFHHSNFWLTWHKGCYFICTEARLFKVLKLSSKSPPSLPPSLPPFLPTYLPPYLPPSSSPFSWFNSKNISSSLLSYIHFSHLYTSINLSSLLLLASKAILIMGAHH